MEGLTLITPTSDRPLAFRLCERWMARAIEGLPSGRVQWIVADDGRRPATCTLGQQHLRLSPAGHQAHSFRRNLLAALQRVQYERIAFIEDDDWYAPDYLLQMCEWLTAGVQIAGEARAKYYNLRTRRYLLCQNRLHASLCQTGIRAGLLPFLLNSLRTSESTFVDMSLWRHARRMGIPARLEPNSVYAVGIKGLPGKRGIGIGHRLNQDCARDADGRVLRRWIGNDEEVYTRLFPHA